MRKTLAFIRRDFRIHTSYKLAFVLEFGVSLFMVATYYFLAKYSSSVLGGGSQSPGEQYFPFVLVGIILYDYSTISHRAISQHVRESQISGNLEALLSTQTSVYTVILSSALYPLVVTSFQVGLYLAFSRIAFGLRLRIENWPAVLLILVLTILTASGIGIISASFVLIFKRGDPLKFIVDGMAWLLGGILYPVSILPRWLNVISAILPLRHAIDAMRGVVLERATWAQVWPRLIPLVVLACVLVPLSLCSFQFAWNWSRKQGSMAEY